MELPDLNKEAIGQFEKLIVYRDSLRAVGLQYADANNYKIALLSSKSDLAPVIMLNAYDVAEIIGEAVQDHFLSVSIDNLISIGRSTPKVLRVFYEEKDGETLYDMRDFIEEFADDVRVTSLKRKYDVLRAKIAESYPMHLADAKELVDI